MYLGALLLAVIAFMACHKLGTILGNYIARQLKNERSIKNADPRNKAEQKARG